MVTGELLADRGAQAESYPARGMGEAGVTCCEPLLGNDYSLLTPPAEGSDQKAVLRYVNPNAIWSSYNKIMIAPVTFWAADDSKVSAADQQTLCNYTYNKFVKDLGKNFALVCARPGIRITNRKD
jgi:hypothetical protein